MQKEYTDFTLSPSLNTPSDIDNTNNEVILSNNFAKDSKNQQSLYGPGRIYIVNGTIFGFLN